MSETSTAVLAIDGPAGAGKSTVARDAARELRWDHLDTGAMYRAVAWLALQRAVDLSDADAVVELLDGLAIEVEPSEVGGRVRVSGQDVTELIRTPEVSAATSAVAALVAVRRELVRRQRAWVEGRTGVVVEGRDIGTAVFPHAAVKVFLTASIEARAARRLGERGAGSLDDTIRELQDRDDADANRAADPLRQADDALVVDTTQMSIDTAVATVVDLARRRCPPHGLAATTRPSDSVEPTSTGSSRVTSTQPATSPLRGGGSKLSSDPPSGANNALVHATRTDRAIWWFCRGVMLVVCKAFFRLRFEGREHLPAGPYILAPVHRSYVDSVVCAAISGRRTRYLGKEEMWKKAWMGRLWDALGGIRVSRGTTDRESMRLCLDALAGGEPLAVFPEGTRRTGPVIEEVFEGAAYMAGKARVPIVPVGIGGSEAAMRPGIDRFPRPRRIVVIIGAPIPPPASQGDRVARSAVRATTAQLRSEMQGLFDRAQNAAGVK